MTAPKVAASAGIAVTAAVVAAVDAIPPPTSIWPTSVATWVGLILSGGGVLTLFWRLHVAGVERAKSEVRMVARWEAMEQAMNDMGGRVTQDLNGFGKRLQTVEEERNGDRIVVDGLALSMAESRADRKHFGETLVEIRLAVKEQRDEIAENHRRVLDAIAHRTP